MIGSIREALATSFPAAQSRPPEPHAGTGLSRADFLRFVAGGALAGAGAAGAVAATPTMGSRVSPVTDIEKLYDAWQERMNRGDLEGLVDLYLDDVTYVNPDGKLLNGKSAVREDFIGLLALKPKIVLGNRRHLLWQDVALTTNHWRMNFTNGDGVQQELTGGGIEVMRKDPRDGGWRYIIDDASRSASK